MPEQRYLSASRTRAGSTGGVFVFLGLALILGALLWARDIRRRAPRSGYRGPWIMGAVGVVVFLGYLWLVTHEAFGR